MASSGLIWMILKWVIGVVFFSFLVVTLFNVLFPQTRQVIDSQLGFSFGDEEIQVEQRKLEAEQREALDDFQVAAESMQGNSACFSSYGGFPSLAEDLRYQLSYSARQDATVLKVLDGPDAGSAITEEIFSIAKMRPCVIAGSREVTKGFENLYLQSDEELDVAEHYLEVDSIIIRLIDGQNKISFDGSEFVDLNDNGFLYTPSGEHLCFFPTVSRSFRGCQGGHADGLEEECLTQITSDEESTISPLPSLIFEEVLPVCEVSS